MLAIQEAATQFELLIGNQKYEEAAVLLADDFLLRTPLKQFNGKADWLKRFPKAHKSIPEIDFGDYEESENSSCQIERRGKKKVAFVTFNVKQVIEADEDGKLKSIVTSKD